jgi:secreted trypsin-like serine protease
MKKTTVLLFALASILMWLYQSSATAISGGVEEKNDFIVAVNSYDVFDESVCTGILWKSNIVITAAHCVLVGNSSNFYSKIVINHNNSVIPVKDIVTVDGLYFNEGMIMLDDIAFLYLGKNIKTSKVFEIASKSVFEEIVENNYSVKSYGIGKTCEYCPISNTPRYIHSTVAHYDNTSNLLYFPANLNHTICGGDSGGPVIYDSPKNKISYIVSINTANNACFIEHAEKTDLFYIGHLVYPYLEKLNILE